MEDKIQISVKHVYIQYPIDLHICLHNMTTWYIYIYIFIFISIYIIIFIYIYTTSFDIVAAHLIYIYIYIVIRQAHSIRAPGVGDVTETTMPHPIALRWSRLQAAKKMQRVGKFVIYTLPETNVSPENWGLGDYFPFEKAYFQGLC